MIIDPMTSAIIAGISVSVVSGLVLGFMKRRWQKQDRSEARKSDTDKAILNLQKSIWRLNKTVLIMAKIIDDQTAKVHKDLSSSLEDIASELLKETDKS